MATVEMISFERHHDFHRAVDIFAREALKHRRTEPSTAIDPAHIGIILQILDDNIFLFQEEIHHTAKRFAPTEQPGLMHEFKDFVRLALREAGQIEIFFERLKDSLIFMSAHSHLPEEMRQPG